MEPFTTRLLRLYMNGANGLYGSGPTKNPSGSLEPSAFYQWSVNISEVNNVTQPHHVIPNNVAKIAAASIARQGRYSGSVDDPDEHDYTQFQFYASG